MELQTLVNESKSQSNTITVEGTVVTGFEYMALDECKEIFGSDVSICKHRGKIFFNIDMALVSKTREMRSVDNLYVIAHVESIEFVKENKEEDLKRIKIIVQQVDLKQSLEIWKKYVGFVGITYPTRDEFVKAEEVKKEALSKIQQNAESDTVKPEENNGLEDTGKDSKPKTEKEDGKIAASPVKENGDKEKENCEKLGIDEENNTSLLTDILKFRATCNRVGSHSFGSMDAARDFGGELQDKYNWMVDLKNFDLEVVLNINDDIGYIGLALTKESMHRRNISHFGPTTLRATLCYNLLRLSQPKVGDIIVDPLCGGGSIPIEGALAFPNTFHICGDIHEKAVSRTDLNLAHLYRVNGTALPINLFQWNAKCLPLRTASVDIFTTDLPFGKRSGKRSDNRPLYTQVLNELARVVRPETGRVVLLSHDRKTLTQVVSRHSLYWNNTRPFNINLGGLDAAVFVLKRTTRIIV